MRLILIISLCLAFCWTASSAPLESFVLEKILFISANANGDASFRLQGVNGDMLSIHVRDYGRVEPQIVYKNPDSHIVEIGSKEDFAIEAIMKEVERKMKVDPLFASHSGELTDGDYAMRFYRQAIARLRKGSRSVK